MGVGASLEVRVVKFGHKWTKTGRSRWVPLVGRGSVIWLVGGYRYAVMTTVVCKKKIQYTDHYTDHFFPKY